MSYDHLLSTSTLAVNRKTQLARAKAQPRSHLLCGSEAESKEKHGVWDPMPELAVTHKIIKEKNVK
jgi:hypothetical protein